MVEFSVDPSYRVGDLQIYWLAHETNSFGYRTQLLSATYECVHILRWYDWYKRCTLIGGKGNNNGYGMVSAPCNLSKFKFHRRMCNICRRFAIYLCCWGPRVFDDHDESIMEILCNRGAFIILVWTSV